jgi:hypothetical protein
VTGGGRRTPASLTVTCRAVALEDLRRHDQWRATLKPPAPPVRHEIAAAIVGKISPFSSFESPPYPFVSVRGEVLLVKRCLDTVRSKRFVVFLARGPEGQAEVARIRDPRQRPIESRT